METLSSSLGLFKTNFVFSTLFAIPTTLAPEDCRALEGTLEISAHLFLVYNQGR